MNSLSVDRSPSPREKMPSSISPLSSPLAGPRHEDYAADAYVRKCEELNIQSKGEILKAFRKKSSKLQCSAPMTVTEMVAICAALACSRNISLIKLENGEFGDDGMRELGRFLRDSSNIKRLYLEANALGVGGAFVLSEVLNVNKVLIELTLVRNSIGDKGASVLAESLESNKMLVKLSLDHAGIGNAGAIALAGLLKTNGTITRLSLEGNNIQAEGAVVLAESIEKNKTLQVVGLKENPFGNDGIAAIASACAKFGRLDFSGCCIETVGAQRLAGAITGWDGSYPLSSLILNNNWIASTGTASLAAVLHLLPELSELQLKNNRIGNEGAAVLADAIGEHRELRCLYVGENIIRDAGALELADAFLRNQNITLIGGERNFVTVEGTQALAERVSGVEDRSFDCADQYVRQADLPSLAIEEDYFNRRDAFKDKLHASLDVHHRGVNADALSPAVMMWLESLARRGPCAEENPVPWQIVFADRGLTKGDLRTIAVVLNGCSTIQSVSLASCQLSNMDELLPLVAALAMSKSLISLDLSRNQMGPEALVALLTGLETSTSLKSLSIAENNGSNDCCVALGSLLQAVPSLTALNCARNAISAEGLLRLAPALRKSKALRSLNLEGNNAMDAGVCAVVEAMHPSLLLTLNVSRVGVSDVFITSLSSWLEKSKSLEELVLDGNNRITDDGLVVLLHSLSQNRSLRLLSLMDCAFSEVALKQLKTVVASHPSITELRLPGSAIHAAVEPPVSPRSPRSSMELKPKAAPRLVPYPKEPEPEPESAEKKTAKENEKEKEKEIKSEPVAQRSTSQSKPSKGSGTSTVAREISPNERSHPSEQAPAYEYSAEGVGSYRAAVSMNSADLLSELSSLNRNMANMDKKRQQLLEVYRQAQQDDLQQEYHRSKQQAIQSLRQTPETQEPLPPIRRIGSELNIMAESLEQQFESSIEGREKSIDDTLANYDAIVRKVGKIEAEIAGFLYETEELDETVKKTMKQRDPDMLKRAEYVEAQKTDMQSRVVSLSQEKNSMLSRQIELLSEVLAEMDSLVGERKDRMRHLYQAFAEVQGATDVTPGSYQRAIQNLQKLLDIRVRVSEAEISEHSATDVYQQAADRLRRAREELHEAERAEEKAFSDTQYFQQLTLEERKNEELFRAKINLGDLSDQEIRALIDRARHCFEYFIPMEKEVQALVESTERSHSLRRQYESARSEIESYVRERKECVVRLHDYTAARTELNQKREFYRQWNSKIKSVQEQSAEIEDEKQESLSNGDLAAFKHADMQLAKCHSSMESLIQNRETLGVEIERLAKTCNDVLSEVRSINSEDFLELLLSSQVPISARSSPVRARPRTSGRF
jgi:Ran GTPase-activating protein (RanGAP) involved in mRNA processing and transport